MKSYVSLGSVSHATMRPEDLIPRFVDALDDIREKISLPGPTTESPESVEERKKTVSRLDDILGEIEGRMNGEREDESEPDEDFEGGDYFESEDAQYDLEKLFDTLNEFAPPFAYFGAHEGDGSDYGFWISDDALTDAEYDGSLVKLNAGDEWPELDPEVEFLLEVTDHGNVTLFTRSHEEVWAVV